MVNDYFGLNIRHLRKQKKMSQAELGVMIDKGGTTISGYEKGDSHPSMADLFRICEYFGVSVGDIVESKIFDKSNSKYSDVSDAQNEDKNTPLNTPLNTPHSPESGQFSVIAEQPVSFQAFTKKEEGVKEGEQVISAQMYSQLEAVQQNIARLANTAKNKLIPYYDIQMTAGSNRIFSDHPEVPSEYLIIKGLEDCDLAVPVVGDSMSGKYNSGDIIACKKVNNPSRIIWGQPYLIIIEDYRLIKYVFPHKSDNDKLCLVSHNKEDNPDIIISRSEVLRLYHIKGKVEVTG